MENTKKLELVNLKMNLVSYAYIKNKKLSNLPTKNLLNQSELTVNYQHSLSIFHAIFLFLMAIIYK